jgi:hypothetical protein
MPRQPALHFGMFMGGIVIADQVQLPVGGDGLVDEAEKLEHSWCRWRSWHRPKTSPLAAFSAANSANLMPSTPLRGQMSSADHQLPLFADSRKSW